MLFSFVIFYVYKYYQPDLINGSFHTKCCKIFEAWTWPISELDKNLPSIRYENLVHFSLVSCTDQEKLLLKVSKVRLKALKLGVQSKSLWFLELYISGNTNPRR